MYSSPAAVARLQYGFTFDEDIADDDTVIERDGVMGLVVDPMSFQYLAGSEVDYQEGLEGSRFVIKNPNAATTCGCGQSFSIWRRWGRYENARAYMRGVFSFERRYSTQSPGTERTGHIRAVAGRALETDGLQPANAMPSIRAGECRIRRCITTAGHQHGQVPSAPVLRLPPYPRTSSQSGWLQQRFADAARTRFSRVPGYPLPARRVTVRCSCSRVG